MAHNWNFLSEDGSTATYKCAACGIAVAFYKEGFGEPFASPPAVPSNIGDYASECSAPVRIVSKRNFLDRFTVMELGGILGSSDPVMKILLFKFSETVEIPLDHPETLLTLQYLVSLGLLAPERIAVILA